MGANVRDRFIPGGDFKIMPRWERINGDLFEK